jgi:serine-type D-Ala-D-Ala carboxypeptidase/endopeptidase (penicillin-binding protein 4)
VQTLLSRQRLRIVALLAAAVAVTLPFAFGGVATFLPGRSEAATMTARRVAGSAASAQAVLPGLGTEAPLPTEAGLHQVLDPLLRASGFGAVTSLDILDARTGTPLMSASAERPLVPASTAKLLTSTAALSVLGPQTTLATRVVSGVGADEVVLVGGGDVLLSAGRGDTAVTVGRAGLVDLAERTAAALRAAGRTEVTLRLDDTLFAGPAVASTWSPDDVEEGFVAPIMALAVNEGQVPGRTARQPDPALAAATTFADLLTRQGITVRGGVTRVPAPSGATELAAVRSAPVGDLVEHTLTESDNTLAEALSRLVADRLGHPTTFDGAGTAVVERMAQLGVPVTGVRMIGGSGLSHAATVPARTLTTVLVTAAAADHPELRQVLTGLPVAGASGTLLDRFEGRGQGTAIGVVRAKTGTLSGVSSLAGTVVDADGRMLVFAVMTNGAGSALASRAALDSVAAAIAGCGCRT